MENILQKLLTPILQQAKAAVQLPGAMMQSRNPQKLLPKEGFVFGKNSKGQTDPNYQIQRSLIFGDVLGSKSKKPATSTPSPSPSPSPMAKAIATMMGRSEKAKSIKPSQDVISAVNQASEKYGVPAELLFDVAAQESSLDPTRRAADWGFPDSTAAGLFQFNDPTWNDVLARFNNQPGMTLSLPNTNKMDPLTSALAAAYLMKMGQLGKWNESQNVWGPGYSWQEVEPYYKQTVQSEIPTSGWLQ